MPDQQLCLNLHLHSICGVCLRKLRGWVRDRRHLSDDDRFWARLGEDVRMCLLRFVYRKCKRHSAGCRPQFNGAVLQRTAVANAGRTGGSVCGPAEC